MEKKLKVKNDTKPSSLAGSIVGTFRNFSEIPTSTDKDSLFVEAIGAGAVNQMCKAVIIALGFLAPSGKTIRISPSFGEVKMPDEEVRTSIVFRLTLENL